MKLYQKNVQQDKTGKHCNEALRHSDDQHRNSPCNNINIILSVSESS